MLRFSAWSRRRARDNGAQYGTRATSGDASTWRLWPSIGADLGQRRRRWSNSAPILGGGLVSGACLSTRAVRTPCPYLIFTPPSPSTSRDVNPASGVRTGSFFCRILVFIPGAGGFGGVPGSPVHTTCHVADPGARKLFFI